MLHNILRKLAAISMVAVVTAMSVTGVSADITDDNKNIIDATVPASLSIYKYDLVAAQTAGVDVSQFAADGEKDTDVETALDAYALKGVQFTYYKVGSINTSTDAGTLKLLYDLPADLETILGLSDASHRYTSDQINTALSNALVNNTSTKNKLEDYINGKDDAVNMALTDGDGYTSSTDMAQGLYLVVETEVPEETHTTTDPFFVSLPMTDATGDYWNYDVVVYPKNQTGNPTIDKLVSENGTYADIATASEGDVLDYRIVSKLPAITSEASYLTKYTFADTISSGIVYNKDTSIAFYESLDDAKNGTGTASATWESGSGNFAVSYGTDTMTVSMTTDGLGVINPGMAGKYMVVAYTATVQSADSVVLGDDGNPNTVTLTYSRTNTAEENTIKDKANVYTYGINLTKTFSDAEADASKCADVQFVLKNSTDDYYVTASGEKGVYYVTDATQEKEEANATVFFPADDGTLQINGLEADTYILKEIHTADGYSLLKQPMTVVFTATVDTILPSVATVTGIQNDNADITETHVSDAKATVDAEDTEMSADGSSANARVDMDVVNTKSFTLPRTGGLGSILFTLAGAGAVIVGVAVITKGKKEE